MNPRKRVASLFATAALLATSLVGVGATDAAAVGVGAADAAAANVCNQHFIVTNKMTGGGKLRWHSHIRPRPYEACGSHGKFVKGTKVWYWCFVYNDYGNLWIYGRVDGTQTKGWVYAPNVAPVAGLVACY